MENINNYKISPRQIADKSEKGNLREAIELALAVESDALRKNTQTFNRNRYRATGKIDDYEEIKRRARAIKEESIANLPKLIDELTHAITFRGGKVFLAKTRSEAVDYIRDVCLARDAKLVVKAKSITSEEIELNSGLIESGVEVAETDLAEFILQVSEEQPSHIVAPAIHRSRETISELFASKFATDLPLDTGEDLTRFARDILRKKFLAADIGITGANIIAADKGALLLVESEGNIRLCTQVPSVHIAIAGIEKIISKKKDFGTFIELLASSGTGQSLTSYTNILEPPITLPLLSLNGRQDQKREFHLVLIDNGRMRMREDAEIKEALYCIRCSACMNSCANFQVVGGHAFGGECYTGGIGGAWTYGTTGEITKARFAELCTGCSRCVPNCPVQIDIPKLNTVLKNRLIEEAGGPSLQQKFFGGFADVARAASFLPGLSNWITNLPISRLAMEKVLHIDRRREIPPAAQKTLERQYAGYRGRTVASKALPSKNPKATLFADIYTNFNNPQVGMATIKVFEKIGAPINLSKVMDDGRGLQSQGLLSQAARKSQDLAHYLEKIVDREEFVIVTEPSVLAMVRRDYKSLLDNDRLYDKIATNCLDPFEYLNMLVEGGTLKVNDLARGRKFSNSRLFYHPHCQMKSIGLGKAASQFFEWMGFVVDTSNVECCGMAGSFGYKKEFFELSRKVGEDLIDQIKNLVSINNEYVILASGTSCREQIRAGLSCNVYHPMEFLYSLLND